MRKLPLLVLIFVLSIFSNGQNKHVIDSLKQVLSSQKEDTAKVKTLLFISGYYGLARADSELVYAQQALQLARKINYKKAEPRCYFNLSRSFWIMGNFYKGIESASASFRAAEELHDTTFLISATMAFCANYRDQGDYINALKYAYQGKRIGDSLGINTNPGIPGHIASVYERYNQLDSALIYGQKAYEIYLAGKGIGAWFPRMLGDIHTKMKHFELALAYYHIAIDNANNEYQNFELIASYNGISNVFKEKNQIDSVIYYSGASLNHHKMLSYTKGAMEAAANLVQAYKTKGIGDSTLKYLELSTALKDSLYSNDKAMEIHNLTFNEQLRQQELELQKIKQAEERKQNIQYAAIALGLIVFVMLFFLLSNSIIANEKLIKFLGILSLLIVFEFINLLVHPYLLKITNHSTLLMLGIMVCIAALLIPFHHRLEKWIIERMVEKNKKIRLASAKKTIAKLEG